MAVSHKKLSAWYLQLAQNLDAGLPLPSALATASGPPKEDLSAMSARLDAGESVEGLLKNGPAWLPKMDCMLMTAAAASGKLPDACRKLSATHKHTGENMQRAVMACLYPLAVLHLGLFLFPIFNLVEFLEDGGVNFHIERYAQSVLSMALPLWMILSGLIILIRKRSPLIKSLVRYIPGFKSYQKAQGLANLAFTLEAFINAGAPLDKAWHISGLVSGDAQLEQAASALSKKIKAGQPPGPYLKSAERFPDSFVNLYQTGEKTGQLDANLAILGNQFQQTANERLDKVSFWYPKLLFLVLAIYAGYMIITFYKQAAIDPLLKIME